MKVLMIGTGMFPIPPPKEGGVEKHMFNLLKELAKLGHEVHCISDVSDARQLEGIRMYEVNFSKLSSPLEFKTWILRGAIVELGLCKKSLEVLSREKYDVIHVQDVKGNVPGLFLSFLRRAPLVFTVHGLTPWMRKYDSIFEQKFRKFLWFASELRFLRMTDHIIVVNKAIRDHLISKWNISASKLSYIPNGVEPPFFSEGENHSVREKYGLPSHYCLFVGQLISRKGVKYLLEALDKSRNVKCVVVGSGPEKLRLARLFEKLELDDKIKLLGNVPSGDLVGLYHGADFFVLPSISEALPLSLLEAMASELPVVVSDLPGLRDVVTEGNDGFLVPPANAEKLCERMEFLAENTSVCKKMGKNAKETAKKYNWGEIAKKTVEVYEKVVSR